METARGRTRGTLLLLVFLGDATSNPVYHIRSWLFQTFMNRIARPPRLPGVSLHAAAVW